MTDISRLQVQLQVTKLQNKDNPLYQLLHAMIGALKDTSDDVKTISGSGSSSITNNITNSNYVMQSGSEIGSGSSGLSATSMPAISVVNNLKSTINNIIQSANGINAGSNGLSAISLSFLSPTSQSVSSGITGSGTIGTIPKWTGVSILGDSILAESGGNIITLTHATNPSLRLIRGATIESKLELFAGNTFFDFTGTLNIRKASTSAIVATLTDVGVMAIASTLAWGGGAAISSSGNVALLNAANVFSNAANTFAATTLTFSGAGMLMNWPHATGPALDFNGTMQWRKQSTAALLMSLTDVGLLSVLSEIVIGTTRKWFSSEASATSWWTNATGGTGSGIAADTLNIYLLAANTTPAFSTATLFTSNVEFKILHETAARIIFEDSTDGQAGQIGPSPHVISGGTVDALGLLGFAGIEFSGDGGTTKQFKLTSTGDLWLLATKKLFFDGGSNTSIRESAADTIQIETNAIDRMQIKTGVSIGNTVDPGLGWLSLDGLYFETPGTSSGTATLTLGTNGPSGLTNSTPTWIATKADFGTGVKSGYIAFWW